MTPRRRRTRPLRGRVQVPGDKSISHRALFLAALAPGRSTIAGLGTGDDVRRTGAALRALGATVTRHGDLSPAAEVEGWGERGPAEPRDVIDAGNSGTTARILLGVLAARDGLAVVTGDTSLRARPMLRVVAPLRSMGARIDGPRHGDALPVVVRGGPLTGADHELAVASAQVKSALLLAGLHAEGTTSVTEPAPSRDHTENMLQVAGVTVDVDGTAVAVRGGQRPAPQAWVVPGDISSAMYLVVAASLVAGSDLTIENVGLNPTRTGALRVLESMGAAVTTEVTGEASGEPVGDIRVQAAPLRGCTVDGDTVPSLIDEIPILSVAASQADGESVFESVGELRAKESDRLAGVVKGLTALGARAEIQGDNLVIGGPVALRGGRIDPNGDHRMAMAFAVAGLVATAPVTVDGWSCVDVSFPTFLDVLAAAQEGR